jgi:uncharacterized protein involved in exopolysaccharide biosynthesis
MPNEMIEFRTYERRPLPTLRDLAAVVFRQRRTILFTFVAVILLVLLSGLFSRKYEAHMKILVLRQRMDTVVTASANAPAQDSSEITEEDLNSEVELLRSDDLLRKVVLDTRLHQKLRPLFGYSDENSAIAWAVRKLGKDLEVEPIRKTNVISIKYRANDPELSASVLNSVAAAYLEKHREVHRPSGEFKFFDQQTEQFRRELEKSQAKLAEFTRQKGVVAAQLERDLTLQRLADSRSSLEISKSCAASGSHSRSDISRRVAQAEPGTRASLIAALTPLRGSRAILAADRRP